MTFTHKQLQKAVGQIHYYIALLESEPLTAGISAHTFKLKVAYYHRIKQWVFRVHSDEKRQNNPNITHDEHILHVYIRPETGVPVPHPVFYGSDTKYFPVPFLITEYIDHNNQLPQSPAMPLAYMLVNIHSIDLNTYDFSFLPDATKRIKSDLANADSHPIANTLTNSLSHIKNNPPTILHGDYWSGNILWKDEEIVGVIDWEDMMRGDPLVDLGKSRLETLWQFGDETMQDYTAQYQSLMSHLDFTYLPFWDLWGAWRLRDFTSWFDDPAKIQQMQNQYDKFVNQAIDKLNQIVQKRKT